MWVLIIITYNVPQTPYSKFYGPYIIGLLIIPSIALFTRILDHVLGALRVGFCKVFCFRPSDVPAHAGFSDLGGAEEGGGGGYFRQVGLRCLVQRSIPQVSNSTGFLPSFREVTLQAKS